MPYSTFAVSKWNCYRGENDKLPLMERKQLTKAMFVVNGIKSFSYEEIKLRGVDACIGEVRKIIKERKFGNLYREFLMDVDDQYFTDNDYGMLSSYFDQFMKEIHLELNSAPIKKDIPKVKESPSERKSEIMKHQIDLKEKIKELQEELHKDREEIHKLDIESIEEDIENSENITK